MANHFPRFNPQMHREVFKITEKIRTLDASSSDLTWNDYSQIMAELCASLNKSLDHGLRDAIRYLGEKTQDPKTAQEIQSILADLNNFTTFLKFEADVLRQCGVPEETTKEIIRRTEAIQKELKGGIALFDAEELIRDIEKFRDTACNASRMVKSALSRKVADHEADKLVLEAFGTTSIITNITFLAWTFGLSVVPSGASVTVGGVLLRLKGEKKDPRQMRPKQRK